MGLIKIGITGGIASGKTTVARMFKALGAKVIDADRIAHQVIAKGTPAYQKIVKLFGTECLNSKGDINRRYLGRIIFADPQKRKKLNAIVHPTVLKMERAQEKKIRKKHPHAMIIYDVPLLIETQSHLKMDKVILVYANRNTQIKRLLNRNRISKDESIKRIHSQMPFYRKKEFADYFINGEEDRSKIEKKVKKIYDETIKELMDKVS